MRATFRRRRLDHPRLTARLLVGGLAAVLVLAACGDDTGDTAEDTPGTTEESDGDATPDPDPADDPADEPDPGQEGAGATEEDEQTLTELFERITAQDASYQLTYLMSGDEAAGMDGTEMVLAFDPPRTAQETVTAQGTSRTIITDDGVISCFQPGGESWECWTVGGQDDFSDAGDLDEFDLDEFDFDDLDRDELLTGDVTRETIAGREAICTTSTDQDGEGTAEVCFDEQTGAMLRNVAEGPAGTFRMEATSFSDQPDTSLFDPPATPQTMDLGDLGDLGDLEDFDLDDFDIEGLDLDGLDAR